MDNYSRDRIRFKDRAKLRRLLKRKCLELMTHFYTPLGYNRVRFFLVMLVMV